MANLEEENIKNTIDKPLGILVNGVELYSPSVLNESIYFGEISEVKILNSGEDYDVITPSEIEILDLQGFGSGAKIYGNMKGTLKEVTVLSPGIGYDRKPSLSLIGGNFNGGVELETNLIQKIVTSSFVPSVVGVSPTTITFISNHGFEPGDEIIYNPNSFPNVVGLVTNSSYYAGVINPKTISLYKKSTDALNKINVIDNLATVVGVNTGIQEFSTKNIKNIIDKVYIKSFSGELFNKTVKIPSVENTNSNNLNGVNLSEDFIYAKNHNLKEKDLVVYNSSGSLIAGLSTSNQYYVKVIDENSFKLASAGSNDIPDDENYINESYITFNNLGTGTHTFSYPTIKILVSTIPGITSYSAPVLNPVVLGTFDSIFIENTGVGYGISEVINLNNFPITQIKGSTTKSPTFTDDAILQPIIVNGKIVDVQILNSGGNYQNNIDIIVDGVGKYAKLYPIITNGKITGVNVLSSGGGYISGKTRLIIKKRGIGVKFLASVKKWTINQYFKNKSIINQDDENGFVIPSKNVKDSLQFVNLFPSTKLRTSIQDNGVKASPILGWAYDGNPILGPYISSGPFVGIVTSGYNIKSETEILSQNLKRPPTSIYPSGYFIEDYEYDSSQTNLDEHNGMFIKNRDDEFPDGTYAYFMTINAENEPVYPYVIGPEFKNKPNLVNYDSTYNQNIVFSNKSYIKNTGPLFLVSQSSGYEYLQNVKDQYKQDVTVTNTLNSKIDKIEILNKGEDYRVGDKLVFKTENEQDLIPRAFISRLNGKKITNFQVGITTYSNVVFKNENNKIIGITTLPHIIENSDYVSISSSINSNLNGNYRIKIKNKSVNLLSNHSASGFTTYVTVDDILDFSVDDFIKIDNETAKIIEIFPQQSRFFVQRLSNLGIHTAGISTVSLLSNKFEFINSGVTSELSIENKKYFNPKTSVGLGTTGLTIVNVNTNTSYSVPNQTIYIPNHQYQSNQVLSYSVVGSGVSGLLVSNTGVGGTTFRLSNGQTVYAINLGKNYLGISTVGYGASPLYFREASYLDDQIHSFTHTKNTITSNVEISKLNITTETPHNLSTNDYVRLYGKEGEWEYYVIKFDLNENYKIKKTSNTSFSINLYRKPEFISYPEININLNNLSYTTDSKTSFGSISDVKIESSSNYYDNVPIIESIVSDSGKNAILLAVSKNIGKVDSVDRIKDGFDYPSDITLQPKINSNVICYLDEVNKVKEVLVLSGGSDYNTPPTLKVIGNESIILSPKLNNSVVESVSVDSSPNNLSIPLEIIPINNSNGFDILNINSVSLSINRIEVDINSFPLIYRDYGEPIVDFPFKPSDLIFIENCRISEPGKNNYNSSDYSYSFFKVVGINTSLGYIDYESPTIGISSFGTYDITNGYGSVVNKNRLPTFKMVLQKNNYVEGEIVRILDSENNLKFSGSVMTNNGWDSSRNRLRLTKTKGNIEVGDLLLGNSSLLKGKVLYLNSFTAKAFLGSSRDKINYKNQKIKDLNSDIKKIQDSDYYQDFSYSIKGTTPYQIWKESVKSIVHPSGFKEFSDLQIESIPSKLKDLKVSIKQSDLDFNINIENENSFYTKINYTVGYEDERINPTTIERLYFGSGSNVWPVSGYGNTFISGKKFLPFITGISNNVIPIKDISLQFTGTYNIISLGQKNVEFNSLSPYYLGVSTSGLKVGDIIGYSSYHEYPNETKIVSIGINSIRTLYPHKVYSGIVTESLEFKRNLNQNKLVGLSSFTLIAEDDSPIYKVVGTSTNINISEDVVELNHNFETGQIVYYENIGGNPIGIKTTTEVIGGSSTDILPSSVYAIRINDGTFRVSGLSTTPILKPLDFTSSGSGIHKFTFDSPNSSTLITIDDIIQTPLHLRKINVGLSSSVGVGTSVIYISSGISSLSSIDILKIEDEYLKIISVGFGSTNSIEVQRGFLGSTDASHTGILTASVYRGNYLIKEDIIHFTSPPFGPSGLPGIEITSKFSGRTFSRSFKSTRPNDKNIILDDISDEFVGLSSFLLTENSNNIVGLYTNTNSFPGLTNINNNPLILINNIAQVPFKDFEIIVPNQNHIDFISGIPNSGKILRFEANQGYGYVPLVSAAATVSVSAAGTISNIYLNGFGSGYRTPPKVNIVSPIGTGASIQATIGASGTITSLTIINSGLGYTTSYVPEVFIDSPLPYYNLSLSYLPGGSGVGTDAKVSVIVGSGSSVENIELLSPGKNYKVGDKLKVIGLSTDVGIGISFIEFNLTVKEVFSDTFTGIYPGQFLQFDDISSQFNSSRRVFDITTTIDGENKKLTFVSERNDIEYNFLIFINDILQKPKISYNYVGGRLVFSEPPVSGSNCSILYYKGSFEDTILSIPLQTIKEGDLLKLESSEFNNLIGEQSERVVKRIIAASALDTFPYNGVGITSNVVRPISWTKQKNDRLINGSYISKSRKEQTSKIYPSCRLIKNVEPNDSSIYVDNAYPLFIELDNQTGGIIEEERNAIIVKDYTFTPCDLTVNVSGTSTISSIVVNNGGNGYSNTVDISLSNPPSGVKDPLYQWNETIGISTTYNFNSLVQGDIIVSVGNSNLIAISTDLNNWNLDTFSNTPPINFKKVGVSTQNSYIAVGHNGKIFLKETKNSSWNNCGLKTEVFAGFIFQGYADSAYTGTFNDVIYNPYRDCWVTVGENGKIYKGNGIGATTFIEGISQDFNYKSIAYNSDVMVAVGHYGISKSTDGKIWINVPEVTSNEYNSIVWDENKFIISSNIGIHTLNSLADSLSIITNSPTNINKISKFNDIYIGIETSGNIYHSFNLKDWELRTTLNSSQVNEIQTITINNSSYQGVVGVSGTIFYSIPVRNRASLSANIVNGVVSSVNITNSGFGYSVNELPLVLIESPESKNETLYTINAIGDFGKIVGVQTSNSGIGTTSPSIRFELLTDYSSSGYESLNIFGINYSQLSIGDYFVITNSNVSTLSGYALTGITTSLGGMSNYPASRVGTAVSYIDGVYRVEYVQNSNIPQGIVTVTCHFVPVNGGIGINTSGVTTNYYGNYSWSKIYDYDDRAIRTPLDFSVNTNNGLVGLSTAHTIQRIPPLIF